MTEVSMRRLIASIAALVLLATALPAQIKTPYEKKATREATILALLKGHGLPTFEGKWHYIGPFDNTEKTGFDAVYPPEREIDLKKTYKGKGNEDVAWKEFPDFKVGAMNNLARFKRNDDACVYLYHEFEVKNAADLPVSFGSDDTLTVWLNGKHLLGVNAYRPAAPDQDQAAFKLKAGKNQLLIKVCNGTGGWELYIQPKLPAAVAAKYAKQLDKDFGTTSTAAKQKAPKDGFAA